MKKFKIKTKPPHPLIGKYVGLPRKNHSTPDIWKVIKVEDNRTTLKLVVNNFNPGRFKVGRELIWGKDSTEQNLIEYHEDQN